MGFLWDFFVVVFFYSCFYVDCTHINTLALKDNECVLTMVLDVAAAFPQRFFFFFSMKWRVIPRLLNVQSGKPWKRLSETHTRKRYFLQMKKRYYCQRIGRTETQTSSNLQNTKLLSFYTHREVRLRIITQQRSDTFPLLDGTLLTEWMYKTLTH